MEEQGSSGNVTTYTYRTLQALESTETVKDSCNMET